MTSRRYFSERHEAPSGDPWRHAKRSDNGIVLRRAGSRPADRGKCVLIVDDHPLNRKLFKAYLQAGGYDVLEAVDGSTDLDQAREHQPHLIVLDLQLPDISGFNVARALKADERTRRIPVIAVTASMPNHPAMARQAGCDGFLTKPVTMIDFLTAVRSVVQEDSDVPRG
jgi:two-component system cell cycle response regulator DivK